jgi:hypothetical protein
MAIEYPYTRPVGEYPNTDPQGQKYQNDRSTGTPISSKKMDGDLNKVTNAINDLKQKIDDVVVNAIPGADDPGNTNKFVTTTGEAVTWSPVREEYIEDRAITYPKIQEGNEGTFLIHNANRTLEEFAHSATIDSVLTSQGVNVKPRYKKLSELLEGSEDPEKAHQVLQTDGAGALTFTKVGQQQLEDEGVTLPKIQKQAAKARSVFVTKSDGGAEVATSPPTDKDGYLLRSQKTARPAFGRLQTEDLDDNIIKTRHIEDAQVTEPKLAANAVTTSKIAAGAATTDKIAEAAITEEKLVAGSVTNSKLGANSVTGSKIKDGNVSSPKLGNNSVITEKLAAQAVTNEKIESVESTKITRAGSSLFGFDSSVPSSIGLTTTPNRILCSKASSPKAEFRTLTKEDLPKIGCQPVCMIRWDPDGSLIKEYNPFGMKTAWAKTHSGHYRLSLNQSASNFMLVATIDASLNSSGVVYTAYSGTTIVIHTTKARIGHEDYGGQLVLYKVS